MRRDIILDENNDPVIEDGDFVVDESDLQHVNHLLKAVKTDYKQFPTTGCGLISFVKKKKNTKQTEHEITTQLRADGYLFGTITQNKKGYFNIDFDRGY